VAKVDKDGLTPQQARFCEEYVIDLNGAQAAIRAGFAHRSARVTASRLLARDNVAGRVADLKRASFERSGLEADMLLKQLAEQSTADLADIIRVDGSLKPVHEWPLVWRQGLVAGIEVATTTLGGDEGAEASLHKVRLADRTKIRELLGKHVKVLAWKEVVEHGVADDLATRLEAAMDRQARLRKA
jgi:phage terminase small subunit